MRELSISFLLLVALEPLAYADPCNDRLADCATVQDGALLVPFDAQQIAGIVPLKDAAAFDEYRRLVEERFGYEMPAEPAVGIWVVKLYWPYRVEGQTLYSWIEASVSIRVKWTNAAGVGEEGWMHLAEPTDADVAYYTGRYVGFPKYYATSVAMDSDGLGGWRATATRDPYGTTVDYHWRPDANVTVGDELTAWTFMRDPFFSITPTFSPTGRKTRTKWTPEPLVPFTQATGVDEPPGGHVANVTALAEAQAGIVEYSLYGDLDDLDAGKHPTSFGATSPWPEVFEGGRDLGDIIALAG
ncbi:MAG: hypothetical protein ACREQ9_03440, partial [Candidatus Binatia bacterium]